MERINLNYDWKYSPDFKNEYISKKYKDDNFEIVNIPHINKEIPYNYFDETMSCFISCYRKTFEIPKKLKDYNIVLHFEACAHYAEVFLNGEKIGEHKGGYTGFKIDITKKCLIDEENVLVVKLDSTEREEIPPFGGVIDYLTYGGIYREVYIYAYKDTYIDQILVAPKDVLDNDKKSLDLSFKFNKKYKGKLGCRILDNDGNAIYMFELESNSDKLVENVKMDTEVNLWDIDNPYLYTLQVEMNGETYTERFGFREAIFKSKGLYLNGKLLKLRGLNRHQSYPYVGNAMPKSAQYADAEYLKYNLGVNIVRTSHYPNSKHFLNRCDEIGLLVFTEIPGWQHISKIQEWRDLCVKNVEEMIFEGYNHPSIILWGVRINESVDDKELYVKTNKKSRELDPSRQTGGVRYLPRSQFLEDVYTFNDFIHSGKKAVLLPKWFVAGRKPYLVTEHNGHMFPTKSFSDEKKREEHALRHARVLNKMYKSNGTSGTIGWCMSDYNTHKDFGSGDKICYHGVSDMFRIDKLAAYVYKAQQDNYGVLEITSNMEIGDIPGGKTGNVYIITNCDMVKMYKNNKHIGDFDIKQMAKKSKEFKYLPHPLLKLEDTVGNQLEKIGLFKGNDAKKMKNLLLKVKSGGAASAIVRYPLTALYLISRYKLGVTGITKLFGEYVTTWGAKQCSFRFDGYKNGQLVASVEKAACSDVKMSVKIDSNELIEAETYDVTRIVVKSISQVGNVLPYANDFIKIETEGPVEVIGPKNFALLAGVRGFWIKTIGSSGVAKVRVINETRNLEETILVNVKKKDI